jgi:hypothetical protein
MFKEILQRMRQSRERKPLPPSVIIPPKKGGPYRREKFKLEPFQLDELDSYDNETLLTFLQDFREDMTDKEFQECYLHNINREKLLHEIRSLSRKN